MKNKSYLFLLLLPLFLVSCSKFLDINEDPNNPVEVSNGLLLATSEKAVADALGMDVNAWSGILSVYTHRTTQFSDYTKYGAAGSDISNNWSRIYVTALGNLGSIVNQATEDGDMQYVGIANILQAYVFSQLVDIFGDVPFSESQAFQSEGITKPMFDKGDDIYPQLFDLLDKGISALQDADAENPHLPGEDDLIYGGNADLWIAAANTIKLKLLNQIRLVENVKSDAETLMAGELIDDVEGSFAFPYGDGSSPEERNPGFFEYFATQRTVDVSPWFYEILKGKNNNIFKGIEDPRIPYYWFNQLEPTEDTYEGNIPEYRDGAFVSLLFGSDGPNRASSQDNSQTVLGIYPVGGKYDDGSGAPKGVSSNDGTGAAPFRMITYADRLFIEAELIKSGTVSGGDAAARDKFKEALIESIDEVDFFSREAGGAPGLAGTSEADDYIDDIMEYYDNHPSQQMEVIITQKWIASFGGNAVEAYNDYRRTGFPVIFDPNNQSMAPGGEFVLPAGGDPEFDPKPNVPVSVSLDYPITLPWASNELDANGNAPAQKDPSTFKVFWMP